MSGASGSAQYVHASVVLMQSLVDWHTHFTMNTLASRRLDLAGYKSAAELLEAVRAAVRSGKYDEGGGRVVGINARNGEWTDSELLTRTALDDISPTKPLALVFNGYHSAMCNSSALEFYGIDDATHSGLLLESEAFGFQQALQAAADPAVVDKWVTEEAERAASFGVTEVVDLEMAQNLPSWTRRCAKGFNTLRVHVGFYPAHVGDAEEAGLCDGAKIPGCGGLVTAGPVKMITDGSLGSQTAFCCDPYPDTSNRGILTVSGDEVEALAKRANKQGLRVAVHAIGDDALRSALTALEAAARDGAHPLNGSTIEHAQLVHIDDLARFKALNLIASVQPRHLVDDIELCHAFWPGRESRAYAFKSIIEAGIPLRLGSDCPVAQLQPWEALACAITRADEDGPAFVPEQIIPLDVAYAASTHNGKTYLSEGDRADIVILHSDPLAADAKGLRGMVVEGTLLAGRWTYRRQ